MTMNERSRENMVFTTHEHVKWASSAVGIEGYTPPPREPVAVPPELPDSWVYFIQAGNDGPIKIGYSKDPYTRFYNIQMGSPIEHTYLGNIPGDRTVEHALHHRFDAHRIRGEWFRPAPELLEYIDTHRLRFETKWRPDQTDALPTEAVTYKAGLPRLF